MRTLISVVLLLASYTAWAGAFEATPQPPRLKQFETVVTMHCTPRAPLEPFDAGVDMSNHSLQVRRDGEVQTWRAVQIEQITPDQLYVAAISDDDDRPALSATFGRDAGIGTIEPQGHHHYLDAELSARCTVTNGWE